MKNNQDTSHISLSIVSSNGTLLNGSQLPQRRFVHIEVKDPDDKVVAEINMTFDQFANFTSSNMATTCTLSHYRGLDGKLIEEIVEQPETVNDRMTNRLGKVHRELGEQISDIRKDVYEMINGGKKGKKELDELLFNLKVLESHFGSNQKFVVKQAQEEVDAMQENMRTQISNAFPQLNLSELDIKHLEGQKQDLLKLPSSEKVDSNSIGYVKKERSSKLIENMTSLELADNIHIELKRLEKQPEETKNEQRSLFHSMCVFTKGNINIGYISYQGTHNITQEQAKYYLTVLRAIENIKDFKQHYMLFDNK